MILKIFRLNVITFGFVINRRSRFWSLSAERHCQIGIEIRVL